MAQDTVMLYDAAGVPILLGQKAMSASIPAVLASDHSTIPSYTPDLSGTGALGALDAAVTVNTQGMGMANFNVTGTWVGTIRAEGYVNGDWVSIVSLGSGQGVFVTSTANDIFKVACAGYSQVRVRMSAYTSGSATVNWDAGQAVNIFQVWNTNASSLKCQPQGVSASGATNSGNPVKISHVYNSSLPTPSTGQTIDSQANAFGEHAIQFRNKFLNIAGNATTTVKSGAGRLHGISINNNTTNGTITVYDNTAGSGTKIFTFAVGNGGGLITGVGPSFIGPLGAEFATGLTIVTAGSANNDITAFYQ